MNSVAVISPSKDQAALLTRAVESVLAQDAPSMEYIVVDRRSSDGALKVLQERKNRLRWISEPDRGLADAVNKGLQATTGEIVGWLNSDDIYFPGAVEAVRHYFDRHPETDVVYGEAHYIDADDNVIGRYPVKRWKVGRLRRKCFLCQPAVFFRRRVLDRCGMLNTKLRYRPDYEFWLRLEAAGCRFAKIDRILAGRRLHDGKQRDEFRNPEVVLEVIYVHRSLFDRVPAKWFLTYGQSKAFELGFDRGESQEFDAVVLRHARDAIERASPAPQSDYRRVLARHCKNEVKGILRRPYLGCRLLPKPIFEFIREHFRRKLFRLNNYPPRLLRLSPVCPAATDATNQPTIAIVTPNLNQGEYLEETIRSVLDQGYARLEYVVQDGGSTDGSVDVIRRHEQSLKSWQSAPDGGQATAINLGFEQTSGQIMAYLNSDDLLLPESLAYVANYFLNYPEVDVVYGHRVLIDEQGREVGRWVLPPHDDRVIPWADYIPQETMFWRRRAWQAVGGGLDESFRFAMDWDLILRFREAGLRFERVPRFLGAFRVTKDQKTKALMESVGRQEMERLRLRELGHVPSRREIRRAVRPYLRRHWIYDKLHTLRLVRY